MNPKGQQKKIQVNLNLQIVKSITRSLKLELDYSPLIYEFFIFIYIMRSIDLIYTPHCQDLMILLPINVSSCISYIEYTMDHCSHLYL